MNDFLILIENPKCSFKKHSISRIGNIINCPKHEVKT